MNPIEARKRIVHIYQHTQNYCETARRCHTSPQLVRKWVKRYQQYGEQGLHDLPKTPKRQPTKTDPDTEQRVLQLHQKTHYGRQRLARHLAQHGIHLSPNTIRHILKRHAPATSRPRKPRRRFYPAHWAWETQEPFTLIQADVKDIYDKGTLGTERWDHLRKHRLPRYQWTVLESRTRLRLLAFSREISTLHGMAFLSLAVSWLRACGVQTEMALQTDWGEEWGGSNPDKIARLEAEFLRPLGAQLGRKAYNGRVERSHRTDDEEFYLPCVLSLDTVEAFLGAGLGWLYYYNYERVHSGYGMEGRTPYACCVALGFSGSEYVGLMPVVLLDNIVLDWSRQGVPAVNDVLTHYMITGGAGFWGYHLAHHFARKGVRPALLDIAPYEESEYPDGTLFFKGDVRNRDEVRAALEVSRPRWVIHGAAALPLWKRADIFSVNVDGTRTVLEEAFRAGVERVAHVSSTAVYGVPKKHPIEETDPLSGVGSYGESKILAERVCEEFRAKGHIVPVIRPKTFIGQARLGVFQILYDWVESGARIPMIGNGRNRYQLLEVTDLAQAYWLACTVDAAQANGTFNIGAERFQTVREDIQALCDFAGSGARPMGTPAALVKLVLRVLEALKLSPLYKWVYLTADKDSFVSIERAKAQLGWQPVYSNAEALIRSYQWYLEHASGLEVGTGVTHRVAWEQGALKVFKWLLGGRKKTVLNRS